MGDLFQSLGSGLDSPAKHGAAVTPNDGADLATFARALWIGAGGDVKITTAGGDVITLASVPGGFLLPIRVGRVWATGTTATSIVALW